MAPLFILAIAISSAAAKHSVDLRPYNLTAAIMFVSNDQNNDGNMTMTEFMAVFDQYDYNKDNVIERHEYVCYITAVEPDMTYIAHGLYDEYDSDHDHKLERHDFDAFYKRMDLNGDGMVTDLEFVVFWEKLFVETEHYSLHGHPHPEHKDNFCKAHGHEGHPD